MPSSHRLTNLEVETDASIPTVDEANDETSSERAHSEASTQGGPFQAGSKRAWHVWKRSQLPPASQSQSLTQANIEAAGLENATTASSVTKRQTMITNFAVQSKPGSRKVPCKLSHYVCEALTGGSGVDILKLSLSLGFLNRRIANVSWDGADAVDRIDSTFMPTVAVLRDVASRLCESISRMLASSDLVSFVYTVAWEALRLYSPCAQFSTNGNPFLWNLASAQAKEFDSLARVTFCICLWPFLQELCCANKDAPRLPTIAAGRSDQHWWICLKENGDESWRHFDLVKDDEHECACVEICDFGSEPYSGYVVVERESLVLNLLHVFLELEFKETKANVPRAICTLLEWDRTADIKLCCWQPFVESMERYAVGGIMTSNLLAEMQAFCTRCLRNSTASQGFGDGQSDDIRRLCDGIIVHIKHSAVTCKDLAGCSGNLICATAADVGDLADKLCQQVTKNDSRVTIGERH